jgi:glycosyltransferase involved in cell wall biosynthesis
MLTLLARQFEVLVYVASEGEAASVACESVSSLAKRIEVLPVTTEKNWKKRIAQWLPFVVLFRPSWALDWPTLQARLPEYRQEAPPQSCVVFRLRLHCIAEEVLRQFPPLETTLDLDDIESATLASIGWFALKRGRLRLSFNSYSKACQAYLLERALLSHYDNVSVANPEDAAKLRSLDRKADVLSVPNRVTMSEGIQPEGHSSIPTLVFVGTLGYFPNEDAALWIAESIVPALRTRLPNPFRILIAGRYASERLRARLQEVREIEFLGAVPRLQAVYAQADIALILVRCGGGTKIKALEAALHHCPMVATPHAMYGLGFQKDEDYLAGNSAEEIASQCALLLDQRARAKLMAQSAYERLARLSKEDSSVAGFTSLPS